MEAVVALDDDSVVVAGYVNGTWNGVASVGLRDFAAVKLHSNGTKLWSWQEGTDANDNIFTAAGTADGNVVLAGSTYGSWSGTHQGFFEAAAVKLDANGTVLWRWQNGTDGTGGVYIYASTARPDGSVVLVGYTFGNWHGNLLPEGGTDFVAVALGEHGDELWRWQDGSDDGDDCLLAATTLDDGSVALAGQTSGNWNVTNLGGNDFAAVKLDVDGAELWRWQDGTTEDDGWETAVTGANGSIILAGYTKGIWEKTIVGQKDFAASALDADNRRVLWSYQAGTVEDEDFNAATVAADGTVILAGWTAGSWDGTDSDISGDFAAVLLDTGAPAITPTPTTLEPAITSPTTTLEPATTPRPTTLKAATTPPPTTPEAATTTPSPVPSSTSSSAPVVPPTSSSSSSTGNHSIVVGTVVGVAALLAFIGIFIFRRRNATGKTASPVTAENQPVCYPQAVTPTSRPPPPYAESPWCLSQS